MGMAPSARALAIRPGVTSMILALPWLESVISPACEPVKERASKPRLPMAIATSAIEMRSPAVSSMSSSRRSGAAEICLAMPSSSSVVSPIADTTTTTSCPAFLVRTTRSPTRRNFCKSATLLPPYFWTTMAMAISLTH